MATFRFLWALALAALPPLLVPTTGYALSFSSSVQRFEADGNGYGSADGVFDLVDEFDDGVLAPNWHVLLGSAEETGGVLRVHDPGVTAPFGIIPQEISVVEGETELGNGDGNFTVTSYWDPASLPTNRQFFFQLYGISPVVEAEGLTVNNLDAGNAAASGAPVGYSIGCERVFPLGNEEPPVQSSVPIDPATITGPIALRMTFDDATDLLTCSFSLDGGATFQSPFAPIQAFKRVADEEILLGAGALPDGSPPPACASIDKAEAKFTKLDALGFRQKLAIKGNLIFSPGRPATFDPANQRTLVSVAGTSSLHLTSYEVPFGALGAFCGLHDGWSVSHTTYKYVNRSGVLYLGSPPCSVSANGLKLVKFKDDRARRGRIRFSLSVDGAFNLEAPGTEDAVLGLELGWDGQNGQDCAGAIFSCVASQGRAICR
jgi:hypothetical protein